MIEKLLKNVPAKEKLLSWCIVALAFSLPFERIPSALISGFSLKVSVVLSVVVIALSLLVKRRRYASVSYIYFSISLLIVWLSARMIGVSYKKEALKVYVPLVLMASMALAISRSIAYINLKRVLRALLLATAIVVCFGLFQFFGDSLGLPTWLTGIRPEYAANRFGFPRLHSTLLEPLYYGNFMLLPLALLINMMADNKKAVVSKKKLIALSVAIVFTDLLTVSRGALAALVVLVMVSSVLLVMNEISIDIKKLLGRLAVIVALVGILLVGVLSVLSTKGIDTDNTYNTKGALTWLRHIKDTRITPNSENIQKDDSIAQRATARNQAIKLLNSDKKYWIVGVGPGQYINKETEVYGYTSGDANVVIISVVMHIGIIGLLLVASIFISCLYYCWKFIKQKDPIIQLVGLSFAAYILAWNLQALTFGNLAIAHLWFVIGLISAVAAQSKSTTN